MQAIALMDKLRDRYRFICISPDAEEFEGSNFWVHPYRNAHTISMPEPLTEHLLNQTSIMEVVLRHNLRPDAVHSFDWTTSHGGIAIARALKIPHLLTIQLSMTALLQQFATYYEDVNFGLSTAIELQAMQSSDAVVHVSNEYLFKYGFLNPHRSYYLPNGIDLQAWQAVKPAAVELPGRPGAKRLCYIGRYAEMKNVEGICLADIPEEVDLYFIGSMSGGQEPYFQLMQETVQKRPNTYYLGPKYGDEKVNTLRAMDAIIVPSHHEPFGIVCLEALASGCTLLSSFASGMGEYLTDDVAIRCGLKPDEISAGVRQWLSASAEDLTERRARGYELCQRYSWANSANTMHEIYEQAFVNFEKRMAEI